MVTTFYCPRCWYQDTRPLDVCPGCGYDTASENHRTYEERLLSALSHPVRDYRMIAIEVLGRLRCREAISPLRGMLVEENDYYLLREAMRALHRIGGAECRDILAALSAHHSPRVRTLAREFLSDE